MHFQGTACRASSVEGGWLGYQSGSPVEPLHGEIEKLNIAYLDALVWIP